MILVDNTRYINEDGSVLLTEEGLIQYMNQSSGDVDGISVFSQELMDIFNNHSHDANLTGILTNGEIDHEKNQDNWSIPDKYLKIDLHEFFISKLDIECRVSNSTDINWKTVREDRIITELRLVDEREIKQLIQWSIWFVDYMDENKLFWGLGRGSSCSVYILYLIGLHLIDPIKCNLDHIEFFK